MKINGKIYYTIIGLIGLVLLIGIASSESQHLGTFKQNTCIQLKQTCANCTFVNVTSVVAPDTTVLLSDKEMTNSGTDYNLTFCKTTQLGNYVYNTFGDIDGILTVQPVDFDITPSGSSSILGLFIIVYVAVYTIGFVGFFGRNTWVAMLGGLAMIILGLYTMTNGLDVFRNIMSNALAWVTVGLGAIFSLTAGVELIEDNM